MATVTAAQWVGSVGVYLHGRFRPRGWLCGWMWGVPLAAAEWVPVCVGGPVRVDVGCACGCG